MRYSEFYDYKKIFRYLLIIIGMSALIKVTNGAGYVVVIPFTLYALFKNRIEWLLFWLFFTNIAIVTNGNIVPKGFIFSASFRGLLVILGLYGMLLFASLRHSRLITPVLGIFIYLAYMIIPSYSGWAPMISYLKLFLFSCIYMALAYAATKAISSGEVSLRGVRSFVLAFSIVYIVGSILLIPFPALSLMNLEQVINSSGPVTSLYMGMMNHSQSLGMVMCFWVTFLIADWMFMIQKPNKLYPFLIVCGLFLLYKSAGRTAMGTMIATTGFLFLCFLRSGGVRAVWKRRVMSAAVFATIVLGLAILLTPQLRDGIMTFVLKYNTSTISLDDMTSDDVFKTRQFLIDEQMYNFKRRPVTGWGFQVTPQVAEMVQYSDGPILTAPVEKGVWVTAILEEGGVIGWIIYVVYFLTVWILLYSRRAFMGLGVFVMIHIVNLGEMTMFSLSGAGGIMYLFLFMALVLDARRLQGDSRRPIWSWGAPYRGGYR